MDTQVILVTGASSGLGKACAERLAAQKPGKNGHRVYGASRRIAAQGEKHGDITMLPMDVDQDASVQNGVEFVLQQEERIDVVINCAGYCLSGPVECTPLEEAKAQFETNFFGTLRVCQAVLPAMRAQRSGLIINVSSLAGLISTPFHGLYSASKYAVEGLSEALSMEVRPLGIRVVIVEPGDFRTAITANRRRVTPDPVYSKNMECAVGVMAHDEQNGAYPEAMAHLVERIVNNGRVPRLRYIVGPPYETGALLLKRILPSRLFEWALGKYYKVEGI